MEKVFCVPGRLGIVDMAVERDGVLVGQISNEPIAQLALRYPGIMLGTLSSAIQQQEEAMKSPPEEISEEKFISMLECLPPVGWVSKGRTESFKISEFTCGQITAIYARIDDRYFRLSDLFLLKHDEIIEMIENSPAFAREEIEYLVTKDARSGMVGLSVVGGTTTTDFGGIPAIQNFAKENPHVPEQVINELLAREGGWECAEGPFGEELVLVEKGEVVASIDFGAFDASWEAAAKQAVVAYISAQERQQDEMEERQFNG